MKGKLGRKYEQQYTMAFSNYMQGNADVHFNSGGWLLKSDKNLTFTITLFNIALAARVPSIFSDY